MADGGGRTQASLDLEATIREWVHCQPRADVWAQLEQWRNSGDKEREMLAMHGERVASQVEAEELLARIVRPA